MTIGTQCSAWADEWAHLRDNAKPVTPADVGQLEVVREFLPPSRAHIKRLTRRRVEVLIVRKAPEPVADQSRLGINRLIQMGEATARACGMPMHGKIYR